MGPVLGSAPIDFKRSVEGASSLRKLSVAKWDRFEQTPNRPGSSAGQEATPRRKIWGLSHTHLANAIDQFLGVGSNSGRFAPCERRPPRFDGASLGWQSLKNGSSSHSRWRLHGAELRHGLTEGDQERTIRGVFGCRDDRPVGSARAFGYDLAVLGNKQGI